MATQKTSVGRRSLLQQPPAVDFIHNRLPKHHKYFENPPVQFDPAKGQYASISEIAQCQEEALVPRPLPEPVKAMKFWNRIFPEAMKALSEQYATEPKGLARYSLGIRTSRTWEDVCEQLDRARGIYEGEESAGGQFRRKFHKVIDHCQPLGQILKVVGDNDYISPVVGAVQILLDAAKEATAIREDMETLCNGLEDTFMDIECFLGTYTGDQNILNASVALVTATLKAIEDVIGYYTESKLSKFLGHTLRGSEYTRSLRDSLEQVKVRSDKLLRQATISDMWQNRRAHEETISSSQAFGTELDGIKHSQHATEDTVNNIYVMFCDHVRNWELKQKKLEEDNSRLSAQLASLNAQIAQSRAPSPQPQALTVYYYSQQHVYAMINVPDFQSVDLEYAWTHRNQLPLKDRQRAEGLVKLAQFQQWMAAPTSEKLLIHGNFDGTCYVSGLSSLCSTLVKASLAISRFRWLVFFCGRHIDENDVHAGGPGIIRSLIAQLLARHTFDMRTMHYHVRLAGVAEGCVKDLCDLFSWLVCQLPESVTLVCLIDGIKYYERQAFAMQMGQVLVSLLDLLRDPQMRCVFKLLVTSPTETRIVRNAFAGSILSMATVPWSGHANSASALERDLKKNLHQDDL